MNRTSSSDTVDTLILELVVWTGRFVAGRVVAATPTLPSVPSRGLR